MTGLVREELFLHFTVTGRPRPKGSMRHVGNGRMIEQVDNRPWRDAICWAAKAHRHDTETAAGPLIVRATCTVPKPASAPKRRRSWPITRASGDTDKHMRVILDALVDAGVMRDDSQVITQSLTKAYPGEDSFALTEPGAVIRVYRITEYNGGGQA